MRRYGKFVDAVWIHQRMRAKEARLARRAARPVDLEAQLVAQITRLYPAGTAPAVIRADAQAALQKAAGVR